MKTQSDSCERTRWIMLGLAGLTAAIAVAMPTMAMPVLFAEMAADLDLTVLQIGAVWGIVSLAGLFVSLAGGTLGDRFGTRRMLTFACLGLGLTGAARGFANDLPTLAATVFLAGLFSSAIPMNLHKVCGVWFSGKRLGMANSVISGGMALGFMLGSMVSATVLSPWLGGWRGVLFFYGGIAVLMSIPWAFTRDRPVRAHADSTTHAAPSVSIRTALAGVIRIRDVWLLGLALMAFGGCIQGFLGYLPLYLRDAGWAGARADSALAAFHMASLAAVLPMAWLSDRFRVRRGVLIIATAMASVGVGLLSVTSGAAIWVGVLMAGVVRDGFMALFMTTVTEVRGVGMRYAGTALGLAMTLLRLGGLIAPPLGNGLATIGPRLPFVVWAAMGALGLVALALVGPSPAEARVGGGRGR